MPGLIVSEPNFEEDISIEVEPEEDAAEGQVKVDPENEDDSDEL